MGFEIQPKTLHFQGGEEPTPQTQGEPGEQDVETKKVLVVGNFSNPNIFISLDLGVDEVPITAFPHDEIVAAYLSGPGIEVEACDVNIEGTEGCLEKASILAKNGEIDAVLMSRGIEIPYGYLDVLNQLQNPLQELEPFTVDNIGDRRDEALRLLTESEDKNVPPALRDAIIMSTNYINEITNANEQTPKNGATCTGVEFFLAGGNFTTPEKINDHVNGAALATPSPCLHVVAAEDVDGDIISIDNSTVTDSARGSWPVEAAWEETITHIPIFNFEGRVDFETEISYSNCGLNIDDDPEADLFSPTLSCEVMDFYKYKDFTPLLGSSIANAVFARDYLLNENAK